MGIVCRQATIYRDRQCPKCGLWFTARGIQGHLRFMHGTKEPEPPVLDFSQSKEVAAAKEILDLAHEEMTDHRRLSARLRRSLFEYFLIHQLEKRYGDHAIPLERLHPDICTQLRLSRVERMERKADQAEAELQRTKSKLSGRQQWQP